ncbi:MAG: beta-Ala-His dipeptidase [Candidatus Lokiarchaeota archaeon]|nr:beta-Ala-His dipeptidase [Candidatus Harpocratesius repetitus]
MVLEHLKPQIVWEIFENLFLATPHESKHEEPIRKKIKDWIDSVVKPKIPAITIDEDEIGNLFISVPASPGYEKVQPLLLQGHMDMVCVSNEPFDFQTNSITPEIEPNGEWITAHGTSLGADNGIGVSMALALLIDPDSDFKHGPLEILITVDEETGLTGAFELDIEKFKIKSRAMLNVDSEELGVITIGSAGGGDSKLEKRLTKFSDFSKFDTFFTLNISGLIGGHSGGDIHLPRANANKLIARMLSKLVIAKVPFVITKWNGGTKHNAITRNSEIVFGIQKEYEDQMNKILINEKNALFSYYQHGENPFEPNLSITITSTTPQPYFSPEESALIITTGNLIPSRAIVLSPTIPGLTETSNNFAIVKTTDSGIIFHLSSRSSVQADLEWIRDQLEQLASITKWHYIREKAYPGWNPDPQSSFLAYVKKIYMQELGKEVGVGAVHGGLETGLIGAKIPGMKMVAIGPDIHNPHSPDERVNIHSVEKMYQIIKSIIKDFKSYNS